MQMAKSIEEYIDSIPTEWKSGVEKLRSLFLQTEVSEDLKWGIPHYNINGKKIAALGAFKSYFGIWFHQGVFLKDDSKVLYNANEGKTKGLRQWRFNDINEISDSLVIAYILEAIENQKLGKEIEVTKSSKTPFIIPEKLKIALEKDVNLNKAYNKLTPFKRKEYCEYIEEAKREGTKIGRLEKCIPMIKDNIGLNDKYR